MNFSCGNFTTSAYFRSFFVHGTISYIVFSNRLTVYVFIFQSSVLKHFGNTKVLYMSFPKFLLAVESHDLSQADKSIIRVSSFHN